MLMRIGCLAIGYLCGCFLTADFVAKAKTGRWAREIGSRNPGMANIGHVLGERAAAVVLLGDIVKVIVAVFFAAHLFPELGRIGWLWAGVGCTLGHNFPFWTGFSGGKGVTTTCSAIILFDPIGGIITCLVGLAVVLVGKQLSWGALAIAVAFCVVSFGHGPEAFVLALVLLALMAYAHGGPALRAVRGEEPQTDLLRKLRARR